VKAPAKVKDLHQRFIEVVRGFAGTLTPAIQAAEAGDLQRFQTMSSAFTGGLTKFQSQLNALRRDFRARGYKLK
jgi:predicted benzoate:H+ symporter BenE